MSHPPRLDLMRLVADELPSQEAGLLRSHLFTCPECQALVSRLEKEQADLLERLPPETLMPRIEQQSEDKPGRPRLAWRLAISFAAVTACILLLVLLRPGPVDQGVRFKGQVAVELYRQTGPQTTEKLAGETPVAGDRLRYRIVTPKDQPLHAALLAFEQDRVVPVIPADPSAGSVPAPKSGFLPGSVVLEKGGGVIRLYLIVRTEPFSVSELSRRLKETGPPVRDDGLVHKLQVDLGEAP